MGKASPVLGRRLAVRAFRTNEAVMVVALRGMVKVVLTLFALANVPPLDVIHLSNLYPLFAVAAILITAPGA